MKPEAPATSGGRRMPGAIWALGFVSLLMDVSSEMIHSLLPVFLVGTLGVSMLAVGLIEGAAEATALVVKVFSGVLSDRWGRRKPLAVLGYGLGAAAKPLFALAGGVGGVLAARLLDRFGKGLRGAPRDALVADIAPPELRGAAFGLRQALDTVGAFLGPVLAIVLMLAGSNDVRAVFWVACLPAVACVVLLVLGVREPPPVARPASQPNRSGGPTWHAMGSAFWGVVALGSVVTLARFSEAFLVLRAQQGGLPLAWTPLVLILMNLVYAVAAYPLGGLADRLPHRRLLAWGLGLLLLADLLLAAADRGPLLWGGVLVWGLHMAMTQGLLAAMVAASAPADRRGTAFGLYNLASGSALLAGSGLSGWLWDRFGAAASFGSGAAFCLVALLGLALLRRTAPHQPGR